jgi:hypothetical protein
MEPLDKDAEGWGTRVDIYIKEGVVHSHFLLEYNQIALYLEKV